MKFKGNGVVRCPICRETAEGGTEARKHFKGHGTWELLLWLWDRGDRGPVVFAFLLYLIWATAIVVGVRAWLGL